MRISLFASDLSSNAMGRVLVLAKVLSRRHEVEIVGPLFGDRLWEPVANEGLEIRSVRVDPSFRSIPMLRRLSRLATGEVLVACKPVWPSLGSALGARRRTGRPVVLDVDDWEWGFTRHAIRSAPNRLRYLVASALHPHLPNAWPGTLVCERLASRADAVIVSNSFLQKRYGGVVVWHGRDTTAFDPALYPREETRRRLGFEAGERIVMFFGTIQPYKGTDDLIRAMSTLGREDVRLALVGVDDNEVSRRTEGLARELLGTRVHTFGVQPFGHVPEFIACADVVVVPQRSTRATVRQMPAKVFDAMAMARPIVATAVSDIPAVLDGCGWVVEPDSPQALAAAIGEALDDPSEATRRGEEARRRCVSEFSWDAMERTLAEVLETLEPGS